jgi:hypothetical protein
MMRKLAVALLLPLALLAMVACSDDDNGGDDTEDEPTAEETAGDSSDEPTDEPTEEDSASIDDSDDGAGLSGLFGTINPLDVLSASSGAPSSGPGDPELQAALLTESDVPSDYMAIGDMNYSLPTEYGEANMAMSMFAGGDLMSGDLDAMVMSAAISMPPEALEEMGDFSELGELGEGDLDDIEAAAAGTGFGFSDLRLLDASGLGEGGAGIHMVMDFGDMLGGFGATGEDNPFANGVAVDMYMFGRGETMLMVMVMEPADGSGIDGKALAEAMDRKIS